MASKKLTRSLNVAFIDDPYLEKNDVWDLYDYRRWKILEISSAENELGTKYEIHCKMQPDKEI